MSNSNPGLGDSPIDSSVDGDLRIRALVALGSLGAVLALLLCFWRLFLYKLRVRENTDIFSSCAGGTTLPQQDLSTSPVCVHLSIEGTDNVECTVCLAELKDGERNRLLPGCGHRFHVECIAMWFRCNSTCPLCRATATAKPSSGEALKTDSAASTIVVVG